MVHYSYRKIYASLAENISIYWSEFVYCDLTSSLGVAGDHLNASLLNLACQ